MMKRYLTMLIALVAIAAGTNVMAAEKEAYAVYTSADNGTLTFYYDTQRSTRPGDVYSLNTSTYIGNMLNYPLWYKDKKYFETVVFTQSFSEYKPTVTSLWFYHQFNLKTISNIVNLHTDEVTEMHEMFSGCTSLTSLDLSSFNTEKVTDMYGMFYDCSKLTSLDLSSFNTEKVTDMKYMFFGCSKLTSLDLSSFNTEKVTSMHAMFSSCESLTGLDLSSFNTEKVTSMTYMFYNCNKLTKIYVEEKWSTSAVVSSIDMFRNCSRIKGELGTTFDENHVDASYARIDGGPSNPGYFSVKGVDIWVGGIKVNDNNCTSLPVESGSASYDFGTNTLTLNNATIKVTAQGDYCIANGLSAEQRVQGIDGLTIVVTGDCKLNGSEIALMINGNTTLTGTGKLSVDGTTAVWIEEGKELTVAVKDFHASATQEVIEGNYGSLSIDGTNINSFVCEPKSTGWHYVTINGLFMDMNDCHFADPEGPWSYGEVEKFNYWDGYYMRYGTQQYCGKVLIEPDSKPVNYRLWVGGTRVTSANKNDILGSGTASYDPTTHTLTLNNANIVAGGYDDGISNGLADLEGMSDFKIVSKGTNSIDVMESDGPGMALYGNTTISGSRLGISAYNKGIFADKDVTLTFKDADIYIEAASPVYSQNGVVNVNHSRLEALPTSLNERISAVSDAKAFNMTSCVFADQGDGIDPEDLYYDTDEQMREICYTGAPYHGRIVIVPTGGSIATGLEEIDNGQWTMDNSGSLYNLHGQRVSHPVKGQIYIQNGRKVKF